MVEENRELCLSWATNMSMCLANTCFQKADSNKVTYQLLGSWDQAGRWKEGEKTQVDFVAVTESRQWQRRARLQCRHGTELRHQSTGVDEGQARHPEPTQERYARICILLRFTVVTVGCAAMIHKKLRELASWQLSLA